MSSTWGTRRHSTLKFTIVPYSKQPAAAPRKNFEKWHRFCSDPGFTQIWSTVLTPFDSWLPKNRCLVNFKLYIDNNTKDLQIIMKTNIFDYNGDNDDDGDNDNDDNDDDDDDNDDSEGEHDDGG